MINIVDNYEDLLYYDGPLIYSGTNEHGESIVGFSISWEPEEDIRIILSDQDYLEYSKNPTSYEEIFPKAVAIYLIVDGDIQLMSLSDILEYCESL